MTDRVMLRILTREDPHSLTRYVAASMQGEGWHVENVVHKYSLEMGRACAIAEARDSNAEFLILLDDDVCPHPDLIKRLPAHNEQLIAGLVPTQRDGKIIWNASDMDDEMTSLTSIQIKGNGKREVYAIGAAILCIRRDLFMREDLDPLLGFDLKADGTKNAGIFSGDDIFLSRKCHHHEIPVYVDEGCVGGHFCQVNLLEMLNAGKEHAGLCLNSGWPFTHSFPVGAYKDCFPRSGYFDRKYRPELSALGVRPMKRKANVTV